MLVQYISIISIFFTIQTRTPAATPELACRAEQEEKSDSRPASKAEEEKKGDEVDEVKVEERSEFKEEDHRPKSCEARSTQDEQTVVEEDSSVATTNPVVAKANNEKIKQLVSTEISLEQQLENVQRQLFALKQLPSEIENHLKIVSEQLHKIMELSGVQRSLGNGNGGRRESSGDRDS